MTAFDDELSRRERAAQQLADRLASEGMPVEQIVREVANEFGSLVEPGIVAMKAIEGVRKRMLATPVAVEGMKKAMKDKLREAGHVEEE